MLYDGILLRILRQTTRISVTCLLYSLKYKKKTENCSQVGALMSESNLFSIVMMMMMMMMNIIQEQVLLTTGFYVRTMKAGRWNNTRCAKCLI